MSSDCPACNSAATEPHCAMFRNGCPGCAARAVSRGRNFFDSKKAGRQTSAYRMELHQFGVTHEQVLHAWKADASNRVEASA